MLVSLMFLLSTNLNNITRLYGLIPSAAFRVKKLQQFLQSVSVRRIAQERTLALDLHESFILKFVQVMGQRGIWDVQLGLDLADGQAVRMSGQQQLHNAQSWFRANRREHIGISSHLLSILLRRDCYHSSIVAEIWMVVNLIEFVSHRTQEQPTTSSHDVEPILFGWAAWHLAALAF
jgi:hypothetical protein